MKEYKNWWIVIPFLLLPTFVFADAGSPMMWFGLLHSLILNFTIGWTESLIISKFKIPNRTWLIILANYVSMIVGYYFIAPYFSSNAGNKDFWGGDTSYGNYKLGGFFAGMFSSYLATLIIEYPFFFLALKYKTQRNKLFFPFFIANTITCSILTLIYYLIVRGGAR